MKNELTRLRAEVIQRDDGPWRIKLSGPEGEVVLTTWAVRELVEIWETSPDAEDINAAAELTRLANYCDRKGKDAS